MNLFKTTLIATALAGACFTGNATAGTDDESFQVTITITESCAINSASNITFADKARSSGGAVTANGTLSVTCTPNTSYQIGLSNGNYYANSSRQMAFGTNRVAYSLYNDAAMTQNWGQNWGTTDVVAGTGTGSAVPITVYGRVEGDANVNVPAGVYSDTVVATIAY